MCAAWEAAHSRCPVSQPRRRLRLCRSSQQRASCEQAACADQLNLLVANALLVRYRPTGKLPSARSSSDSRAGASTGCSWRASFSTPHTGQIILPRSRIPRGLNKRTGAQQVDSGRYLTADRYHDNSGSLNYASRYSRFIWPIYGCIESRDPVIE